MSIQVALQHTTHYRYGRPIELGPQIVRLRPAPHTRTPILSYSLTVAPKEHFINWQQDPNGNFLARLVFPRKVKEFCVQVDLIAEMSVINPFDFFLEPNGSDYPFSYAVELKEELETYFRPSQAGPLLTEFIRSVDRKPRRTIDFLVELNQRLQREIAYVIRLEPGVQSCDETLTKRQGSCRDSASLLMEVLRHLGFAARFASGYLIQLKPDQKPLEGPAGAEQDFTDLHAWTEVYLPGAGWVGLDPTSGLLTGEGHIPLACTPSPSSAAPITGTLEECQTDFAFAMSVRRIYEDPRVTKPYTEETWETIQQLGSQIDRQLKADDVRLTMGGEPTFVSIDDMEGDEWRTAALGTAKRRLGHDLLWRLRARFARGGLLYFGQGKWYPGESLPRWAFRCYWRVDGEPLWRNDRLVARDDASYAHTAFDALRFGRTLARRLAVEVQHVQPAYEDAMYYMWKERRLPANVDLRDNKLEDEEERVRLARIFEQGITSPVGCLLPLQYQWWLAQPRWRSGWWQVRADSMFLLPGDSPMGYRLPLQSLIRDASGTQVKLYPLDPAEQREGLPDYEEIRRQLAWRREQVGRGVPASLRAESPPQLQEVAAVSRASRPGDPMPAVDLAWESGLGGAPRGRDRGNGAPRASASDPASARAPRGTEIERAAWNLPDEVIRTALCVEARGGRLFVFMPPLDRLEAYVELIAAIEDTAEELQLPVAIEGYPPPHDDRLRHFSLTPDPGVLEVNVHPAANWQELTEITTGVYTDARAARLGTEKFELDGTHTGTGGGNHVVLGGPTPNDSPFLRRPDMLRSLLGYWHNHPSLSYLFSGRFLGPTSQAPRVDEGRRDSIYELQIAFEQIPEQGSIPPWLVDRVFRHLLVDGTGNTHRAEFCIDKLYSPDSASGRLGLVEFRAFEMPPHYQMSLTQQLLLRALIARFWREPYRTPLVNWDTMLHDRFLLPYFLWQDFEEVVADCQRAGHALQADWFAPHFEFRFPKLGEFTQRAVQIELRQAIEPWYVLGEEPAVGAVARYVDSSLERIQVLVRGMINPRFVVACNGRRVPLHPTGTEGEFVAGVRYRAWQPPSCLHPTLPVDSPLLFDLIDLWSARSLGGCRYHVGHPGGLNPTVFPVNAYEAESRRACRFFAMGHTPGTVGAPALEPNADFPLTLDLRKNRH